MFRRAVRRHLGETAARLRRSPAEKLRAGKQCRWNPVKTTDVYFFFGTECIELNCLTHN
jgi:hypothetical protein